MGNNSQCINNRTVPHSIIEWYFYPVYFTLCIASLILNILFLTAFLRHKKRSTFRKNLFNYLTLILIILDFCQSLVMLFDVFLHLRRSGSQYSRTIEAFFVLRNYLVGCHALTLLLMAINRYRALQRPLHVKVTNPNIIRIYRCIYVSSTVPFLVRLLLLLLVDDCRTISDINFYLKKIIGIAAATVMVAVLTIYSVLFILLCLRNVKSVSRQQTLGMTTNLPENIVTKNIKHRLKIHFQKSLKFAQVLFSISILMMISYTPLFLTNVGLINDPGLTIYYLFYMPAFGDPFILLLSRDDFRKEMAPPQNRLSIPSTNNTLSLLQPSS